MEQNLAFDQRKAWTVVALLFFYTVINFFDKLVFGLAAVPIMKELQLTPAQYGLVASSFFWLYAVSGVLVGLFVVNRIKSKWLLIVLVAIWSASQAPIAFSSSVMSLVICRVLLGLGEGPGTPSAYEVCHSWFPSERRNLPTALLVQGTSIGYVIGAPLLTYIILEYGWRSAFLFCSALGVVWIIAWMIFGQTGPISSHSPANVTAAAAKKGPAVPWTELWFDRTMIGNYILGFGSYWVVGLTIAWMAPYLQQALGYNGKSVGWLISVMYATHPPVILAISYLSERMLRSGMPSRLARGVVNSVCLILSGVCLTLAMMIDLDATMKVVLLACGFLLPAITFALGPAMVSEVVPTSQRGTALLVTYSVITVAGFISPVVMGYALQAAGPQALAAGYTNAFLITATVLVAAGLAGLLLLNPDASKRRLEAVANGRGDALNLTARAA